MHIHKKRVVTYIDHAMCDCGGEYNIKVEVENIMENIFASLHSTNSFRHACNKCGKVKYFNKVYPDKIETEVDDEMGKTIEVSDKTSKLDRPLCPVCNTNKRVSEVNNNWRSYSAYSDYDIKVTQEYKCTKCNGHFFVHKEYTKSKRLNKLSIQYTTQESEYIL